MSHRHGYKPTVPGPLGPDGKREDIPNPMAPPGTLLIAGEGERMRLYQVQGDGAYQSDGISFNRLDLAKAFRVPVLRPSRSLSDRSKYKAHAEGFRRRIEREGK